MSSDMSSQYSLYIQTKKASGASKTKSFMFDSEYFSFNVGSDSHGIIMMKKKQ